MRIRQALRDLGVRRTLFLLLPVWGIMFEVMFGGRWYWVLIWSVYLIVQIGLARYHLREVSDRRAKAIALILSALPLSKRKLDR